MSFAAAESNYVYLWLFAVVLGLGRAANVSKNSETTDVIRIRRLSPDSGSTACLVPQQPMNGRWKLHRQFCDDDHDCDVPQGIMVQSGSQLVYRCDTGYRVEGNFEVYCKAGGKWSTIPTCVQIKCSSLTSVARKMTNASYAEVEILDWLPFNATVFLSCRIGYKKDMSKLPDYKREKVSCSTNGMWDPKPVECIQVCGIKDRPLYDSTRSYSLWHASLYVSNGTRKNLRCGTTILKPKILLTAALCVYDEKTESTIDPGKLFVMTGNILVDYHSRLHNPNIVKKAAVKAVYIYPDFAGIADNYTTDMAILELQEPFVLSNTLIPACLYLIEDHEPEVDPGKYGTLVGFGLRPTSLASGSLRNLTLPYTSRSEFDDFTTSSTNGSGICGSGIVFKKNNLWYVRGILTIGYDEFNASGERTCNGFSDARYTRISDYINWIGNEIETLDNNDISLARISATTTRPPTTPTINSTKDGILPDTKDSFCLVPPQPENGEWRLHGSLCKTNADCNIPQGAKLMPGTPIIYICTPGYRVNGYPDVYCRFNGQWSAIPECIEVRCDGLNSVSMRASCSHFGKTVNCDYPVPAGTRAEISCSKGYEKDTVFIANQRDTLICGMNGQWKPEPIRCIPVCGVTTTSQTPLSFGGTPVAVGDFPWHVTLYRLVHSSEGSSKEFICGATIIHRKLLLTAAHCVYGENTKTAVDPANLFVVTGNIFRNYNSLAHDPQVVKKAEVKNVLVHMNYFGFEGNYGSDIALLELKRPFEISETLLPACLDIDGRTDRILQPGAYGKVAGFGRTASAVSSANLQTVTLPFVSYSQCRNSSNDNQIKKLINDGKFCAGYRNGTSVCEGDSGGGLVFRKNQLWYVMGIVSVGLGVDLDNGQRTCDRYSYTLYTKVSTYMNWIRDGILNLEQ